MHSENTTPAQILGNSVRYSVGLNTYDNTPEQREAPTFAAFRDDVLGMRSEHKGETYICAPMSYGCHDKPADHPGDNHYRLASHDDKRRFLCQDYDGFGTPEDFPRTREHLCQFSGFAYTTASHKPTSPRARAVLELSRAVDRLEGIRLGVALQNRMVKALGVDAIEFDTSVYRAEQPCYTPVTTSETYVFDGAPLNVDELLAEVPETPIKLKSGANTAKQTMPETPENVDIVRAMLARIPAAGYPRDGWRNLIWSIAATGWGCAKELARSWCLTSPGDLTEAHFEREWKDYDPNREGGISFATLVHLARQNGYTGALPSTVIQEETPEVIDWPEPRELPPKYKEPRSLDPEAELPSTFAPYVADCSIRMQVPAEMVAVPLIISFGSVVGKRATVQPKANDSSWVEYGSLWGVSYAPPGFLKSPTMNAGLKFIEELERDAMLAHAGDMQTWESEERIRKIEHEARQKEAKKLVATGDTIGARSLLDSDASVAQPKRVRHLIQDATPEARIDILTDNPHGVMQALDEIDGLIASMRKDGYEAARSQMLQFFDGKQDYATDRVKEGRSSVAEAPRMSLYGGAQPAKLEKYLHDIKRGGNDDGFLQRLNQLGVIPTLSGNYTLTDTPPDKEAEEQARAVFKAMASSPTQTNELSGRIVPRTLKFDPKAQAAFDKFLVSLENRIRKGEVGGVVLASHVGKYRGTLPKLALVFALAENPAATQINMQSFRRANKFLIFLLEHAKRIYAVESRGDIIGAHDLLARIRKGQLKDGFSVRDDIQRREWEGLRTAGEIEGALVILKEHGYIREVVTQTAGRPARTFAIHPSMSAKK